MEQMTDAEVLDLMWPDGHWKAWTQERLTSELRWIMDHLHERKE